MRKITDLKSGIYILEIFFPSNFTVGIKKFNHIEFNDGYYYYVGSAQKNLGFRLKRHLKKEKTRHWHIDHLTTLASAEIKSILIFEDHKKDFEEKLAADFLNDSNFSAACKGFGSGDSPKSFTHLFYSGKESVQSQLLSKYQSAVLFTPS